MRQRNVKNDIFVAMRCVFQALNTQKLVFGRGSAPDPAGGAYDAPRPPSRLGRVTPSPYPSPSTPLASRSRRLGCQAPQQKFLATPLADPIFSGLQLAYPLKKTWRRPYPGE